jgi:tetratricopeptide (TPR) repeat protein
MIEGEDNYVGKQIGNYRITNLFDSGSFGRIYRATHIYLPNRIVAIKVMHLTFLGSQQERDNFLQEARLLDISKHPNILSIHDLGIEDGFPYIIAEFAPNGSLRNRIQRYAPKPMPQQKALTILTEVGQALHYVHEQLIVHRDLKPENILFNAKNEALIADFGIAVFLETQKTKYVNVIGSPHYMPPEQFEGFASRRSDQYALACIAYELFTGQPPFTAGHPIALWNKHQNEQPRPLRELNPAVPAHIERAILTALAKKREDRYHDVATFVSDLLTLRTTALTSEKTKQQWVDDGNNLFNVGRYMEALNAFDRAIRLDPNYPDAYEGRGSVLYQLERYAEALASYEQAINLDPQFAQAYFGKGNVLYYLKHYNEALTCQEQAISCDSTLMDAYLSKANVLYYMRRFPEALAMYEEVARREPSSAQAYDGMGWTLRQLLRHKEALAAYERALELDSNNPSSQNGMGRTLYRLGCFQEALPFFDKAEQLDSRIALTHEFRGDALYHMKRYADALAEYNRSLELDSRMVAANEGKAKALWHLHRPEEALPCFERAIKLNPKLESAYEGQGSVLSDLKRYEESLTSFEYALQLNPRMASAHNGRGNALADLKRYDEALEAYNQAIQLQPTMPAFYMNKSDVLKKLGRHEEAQQAYERAKSL